jgi:hypothetical protein
MAVEQPQEATEATEATDRGLGRMNEATRILFLPLSTLNSQTLFHPCIPRWVIVAWTVTEEAALDMPETISATFKSSCRLCIGIQRGNSHRLTLQPKQINGTGAIAMSDRTIL